MPIRKLSRYIDDPLYFLFWTIPEVIPLISAISLAVTFGQGHFWSFTGLGLLATYLLRKFNARQQAGYLQHYAYQLGLFPWVRKHKFRTFPNAYERIYLAD